jgi:hypothetical protein
VGYQNIIYETFENIGAITLNRPEKEMPFPGDCCWN